MPSLPRIRRSRPRGGSPVISPAPVVHELSASGLHWVNVVSPDVERGLLLIQGSVPGAPGGYVLVKDAVKRPLPKEVPFPAGLKGAAAAEAQTAAGES